MRESRPILALGVIVSFLWALLLAPESASASVRTRWDTTPACVDATSLPSRVDALLQDPPTRPVRLSLGAAEADEAWTISMRLDGLPAPLSRTLRGRDCHTLTEAVALVVAVQIDAVATATSVPLGTLTAATDGPGSTAPALASGGPAMVESTQASDGLGTSDRGPASRSSDSTDLETSPAEQATGSTPRAPSHRPRARARARPVLGTALAGELGVLPRGGGSLELGSGLAWPRARLEAGALVSTGPPATAAAVPSVGGRFVLLTGLVRGCGVVGLRRMELPLCGGLELGDLRARGTGLERPRTVDTPWIAMVAGARPQWRVHPSLWLGGLVDLVVPLRRHHFQTSETGTVHLVSSLAVRLGVRLQWRLP